MNEFVLEHDVLKQYNGTAETVTVPEGVREIGYRAFQNNHNLKHVILPQGVCRISGQAFSGCNQLEQADLPRGLADIRYSAFEGCTALRSVELPYGMTELDRLAFAGCTSLETILFPDTLRVVGKDALAGTPWLDHQPDGVVYAGRLALFARGDITQADICPGTIRLCDNCFRNCRTLTAVTLPDSLEELDDRAFQNCFRLEHITIPAGVTRIGYRAFDECNRLQVELQAPAPFIGKLCFSDRAQVHITAMDPGKLPDNIRSSAILAFAKDFTDGTAMQEQFRKRFLRYIRSRRKLYYSLALENSDLLQMMLQERMIPLDDVDNLLDSMLTAEQAEASAALMQYKQRLQDDEDDLSLDIWDDLELGWDIPEQEKTTEQMQKEWNMRRTSDGTTTLVLYRGTDLDLTIPARIGDAVITAISPAALSPQRYGIKRETADHRRAITSVILAEGITRIGNHAFAGCENLRSITLPESVTDIGYEAFKGCTRLAEAVIPSSVETIGKEAFAGCESLQTIVLTKGTVMAEDAFAGCPGTVQYEDDDLL